MNIQIFTMIAAVVIALILHLYMKYQDKNEGYTENHSSFSGVTQTETEVGDLDECSYLRNSFDPGYIGIYKHDDD